MSATTSTYAGVGTAYLQSGTDDESDKYTIHGVAIGAGDITIGQSGTKKLWPADELKEAADTLQGKPLVRDHNNTTEGRIGTVTYAEFTPDIGVIYEAEIADHYEELVHDIHAGLMEVSIRAYHAPEEELEEDASTDALIVDDVYFDNLSVVNDGAAPSNTAETGPVDNITDGAEAVASGFVAGSGTATATLERSVSADRNTVENAYEHDPGYDDMGRTATDFAYVTIDHQSTDGSTVMVDSAWAKIPFYVCMYVDGSEHYHGGHNLSASYGQAGPFEAGNEADDIEVDLENPLRESQTVHAVLHYADSEGDKASHILAKHGYVKDCATAVVDEELALGVDDTPTDGEPVADDGIDITDELASIPGTYEADGTVYAIAPDEHPDEHTEHADDAKYPLTSCTGDDSVEAAWRLRNHGDYDIDQSTLEERIRRAADAMDCDLSMVEENGQHWMPDEGRMVEWRANPDMWGKVVHVDTEEQVVMVEVMTDDGESTGHTVGAQYSDVQYRDDAEAEYSPDHEDVFATEDDAIERSQELGLEGETHPMDYNGETYYMPGADHDDYMNVIEEMGSYSMHEPFYEETTDAEFSEPTLDDWEMDNWDDMNDVERDVVSEHYLLSSSGFPPEQFDDLMGAVVTADGALSLEAMQSVYDEMDSWDLGEDLADDVRDWLVATAQDEFDADLDASMSKHGDDDEYAAQDTPVATSTTVTTAELSQSASQLTASSLPMIEYESADVDELPEEFDELDDAVVVEREELEDMADKAEKADDVEAELEQLSEKLDEQTEADELIAELSDDELDRIKADAETTVVEAEKAEMVDDVTSMYAEEMAEHSEMLDADELAERWTPLELKSKVEDHSTAELSATIEETEPEPDAGAVEADELGDDDDDEEALRQAYAAELESHGWDTQAEKVRSGELPVPDSE